MKTWIISKCHYEHLCGTRWLRISFLTGLTLIYINVLGVPSVAGATETDIRDLAEKYLAFAESRIHSQTDKAKTDLVGRRPAFDGKTERIRLRPPYKAEEIEAAFRDCLAMIANARREIGRVERDAPPMDQHYAAQAAFAAGVVGIYQAQSIAFSLHRSVILMEWYVNASILPEQSLDDIRSKSESPNRQAAEALFTEEQGKREDEMVARYAHEIRSLAKSMGAVRIEAIRTLTYFKLLVVAAEIPPVIYRPDKNHLLSLYDNVILSASRSYFTTSNIELYRVFSKNENLRFTDLEPTDTRFKDEAARARLFARIFTINKYLLDPDEQLVAEAEALVRDGKFDPFANRGTLQDTAAPITTSARTAYGAANSALP